jgi:hypothetical protein
MKKPEETIMDKDSNHHFKLYSNTQQKEINEFNFSQNILQD